MLGDKPNKDELNAGDAEFLEHVDESFSSFNIPVFIYSGYLASIEGKFENRGTVFKVDKENGINVIYDKIQLFQEAGFLDVFCPGGVLQTEIHKDLHRAFVEQFKKSEDLENIINSIKSVTDAEDLPKRIERVFKRIAVRALLTELLSPEIDGDGALVEESVGSTEHYVHRINQVPVWTGDLFKKKGNDEHLFILTPRCNVIRNDEILVCPFALGEITKPKNIGKALQGDPTVSGYDRYLPPSPTFKGGKLLLSKFYVVKKDELLAEYERVLSLSDELTNEILGKFGAYFFRTGITPWHAEEIKGQLPKK